MLAWMAIAGTATSQQGVVADVLSGSLIKPSEGQWAWYELTDTESGYHYALRQAIVGRERVGWKTGYWLEVEVVPNVGYRSVYKMLLTGPASDPRNVHRLIVRDGLGEPQEIPLPEAREEAEPAGKSDRTSLGAESVKLATGESVEAEHLKIEQDGGASDVWVNDAVRPMGIVRMVSSGGELLLRSYGEGGDNARSVMDEPPPGAEGAASTKPKVEVRVEVEGAPSAGGEMPNATEEEPAEEKP